MTTPKQTATAALGRSIYTYQVLPKRKPNLAVAPSSAVKVDKFDISALKNEAKKDYNCTITKGKEKYKGDFYVGDKGGDGYPHYHINKSEDRLQVSIGKNNNFLLSDGSGYVPCSKLKLYESEINDLKNSCIKTQLLAKLKECTD